MEKTFLELTSHLHHFGYNCNDLLEISLGLVQPQEWKWTSFVICVEKILECGMDFVSELKEGNIIEINHVCEFDGKRWHFVIQECGKKLWVFSLQSIKHFLSKIFNL